MVTIESGETCLHCCEVTRRNLVFHPTKLLCYSHEGLCDSSGYRHVQSLSIGASNHGKNFHVYPMPIVLAPIRPRQTDSQQMLLGFMLVVLDLDTGQVPHFHLPK